MQKNKFEEQIENSSGKDKFEALVNYSTSIRQSDSQKSAELAKEATDIAETLGYESGIISGKIAQAYARLYNSEFEKVQDLTDEIIVIALKDKIYNSLGTAYNLKARIAYKTGHAARSLELNLKALDYYLKDPVPVNLLSCYNNIGMSHEYLNEEEEAISYYDLAIKEAEKAHHPAANVIRMNIGTIYFKQGRFQEALDYYYQAKKYFKNSGLLSNLASVDFNIGLTYQELGNSEKCLSFFTKSYELQRELNNPKDLSYTCHSIAGNLLETGKMDEALKYLDISYKVAEENNLTWNLMKTNEAYSIYWEKNNDYKKANQYLRQMVNLNDQINKEVNQQRLTELEAKYKTRIYKLKTEELHNENKAITEQLGSMEQKLQEQREMYENLEVKFKDTVKLLNEKDNMLSVQSRTAVMGEMLSLIAHQWKQPLNTIGVLVQSFQDAWEYDELSEEFITKQIGIIMKQILYMSETITDFRDFLKPERKEYYSVNEAVKKSLGLLDFVLKKSNIEVIVELQDGCELYGVSNDLIQVILNIINNARQSMTDCNKTDCIIRVRLKENEDKLTLQIFNSGKQISEDIKHKLFEPYFTTRGEEGTGIGLYICRMIVENKNNGTIRVENVEGGVEFSIEIPLKGN